MLAREAVVGNQQCNGTRLLLVEREGGEGSAVRENVLATEVVHVEIGARGDPRSPRGNVAALGDIEMQQRETHELEHRAGLSKTRANGCECGIR